LGRRSIILLKRLVWSLLLVFFIVFGRKTTFEFVIKDINYCCWSWQWYRRCSSIIIVKTKPLWFGKGSGYCVCELVVKDNNCYCWRSQQWYRLGSKIIISEIKSLWFSKGSRHCVKIRSN
jgi:hypothetical protein